MAENSMGIGPGGAPLRRSGRTVVAPAEAQAKKNADFAANTKRRENAAAKKKYEKSNVGRLDAAFGGVEVNGNDDLLAGLLGGPAAAAPKASPYLVQLKRDYNSARKALEDITKNNIRENNGTVIQSAIGLIPRQEAEEKFKAAKAVFEEAYGAEGNPPLEGGLRRRRAKKTKRRAHKNRRQTKRR
jgi:hypothetical protein